MSVPVEIGVSGCVLWVIRAGWYRSGLAPLCLSLLLVEREGVVGLFGGRFLAGGGEALYGEFGDG